MSNGSREPSPSLVKSAARALDILTLLSEQPEGLSMTEMSKILEIPISSIHALIGTLSQMSFVLRDLNSYCYRLGPKILQIASSYRAQVDLITLSDPVMDRIRQIVGETISLTVLQGQMIMFVHKKPAEGVVKVVNPIGTRLHSHATGSGKVMLSYLDDEELDSIYPEDDLPTMTPTTITTKASLRRSLSKIRKQNYAYDNEESALGVWAVASCIRDDTGRPIAALSIVGPTSKIASKDVTTWYQLVRNGAAEISSSLVYFEV